jgi:hypothetical protein
MGATAAAASVSIVFAELVSASALSVEVRGRRGWRGMGELRRFGRHKVCGIGIVDSFFFFFFF